MKKFSEMDIKPKTSRFSGDKVKISRILNKEIVVHDFKIEPSKYPKKPDDKVLTLQLTMLGQKHILFTSSNVLMDMIQQVNKDDFPFSTIIVQEGESYEFR